MIDEASAGMQPDQPIPEVMHGVDLLAEQHRTDPDQPDNQTIEMPEPPQINPLAPENSQAYYERERKLDVDSPEAGHVRDQRKAATTREVLDSYIKSGETAQAEFAAGTLNKHYKVLELTEKWTRILEQSPVSGDIIDANPNVDLSPRGLAHLEQHMNDQINRALDHDRRIEAATYEDVMDTSYQESYDRENGSRPTYRPGWKPYLEEWEALTANEATTVGQLVDFYKETERAIYVDPELNDAMLKRALLDRINPPQQPEAS